MSNIEIVKVILSHIGEDPKQDKALAQGCIVILGGAEQTEPAPSMGDEAPKSKTKTKPKVEPKRELFDVGKMKALYDRGWSAAMVADEMGVSVQTIYNKAKKEGLKFGKAVSV